MPKTPMSARSLLEIVASDRLNNLQKNTLFILITLISWRKDLKEFLVDQNLDTRNNYILMITNC
jgi:hypothetical protein